MTKHQRKAAEMQAWKDGRAVLWGRLQATYGLFSHSSRAERDAALAAVALASLAWQPADTAEPE